MRLCIVVVLLWGVSQTELGSEQELSVDVPVGASLEQINQAIDDAVITLNGYVPSPDINRALEEGMVLNSYNIRAVFQC
jgi:hypothetical protein